MERKSRLKNKTVKGAALLFAALALLGVISIFVHSLAFNSGPTINGGGVAYTVNDLVCSWTPSADMTQTNVSWFNGSTLFLNETVSQNSSTLGNQYTTRDESWTCQVTMGNGTGILAQNTSIMINNTAPSYPGLTKDGSPISNYYDLYEDSIYVVYINASDNDNDVLKYYMDDDNSFDLCSPPGIYTGQMSCNVSHQVIKQSSSLGPEQSVNHTITITARENGTTGISTYTNFIFTLIPVNDKPYFTGSVSDQSINAGHYWSVAVTAEDEELNYPLNFTVSSDLNNIAPGLVVITNLSSITANVTFSAPTTNSHVGTWSVTVNITDFNGTNVSQLTFALQINTSNYNPAFTTNFSQLSAQSWTQGNSLQFWLNATDANVNDTLTFNMTPPSNTALRCNVTSFPWSATTVNNSYLNASGSVSVANLTNDYVACRYVNLIVSDQFGGTSNQTNFLLNITNANDPPVIYEIGLDGNMSNLSVRKFQTMTYRINATDPDSLTYDINATANLTFYSNDSIRFPINATTGTVTIYPGNDSFIGNWTVNLTVSDGEFNYSRNMVMEIRDNFVPILNLSQNNLSYPQNNVSLVNFSVAEPDNDSMNLSFNTLTLFSDDAYVDSFVLLNHNHNGGINTEFWTFNLSRGADSGNEDAQREILRKRNDLVGNHLINITFMDVYESYLENTSSGTLNITVTNENDAPFFDMDKNNVSDLISFTNVVFNYSYSIIINATDFDLYLGEAANESLTFNYSDESAGLRNISMTPVPGYNNSAVLNFTGIILGNQSITITVTDSGNLSKSQNVSFEVDPRTPAPVFHLIKPYFNTTLNYTVMNFADAELYPDNFTDINTTENTTFVFDAYVTNASAAGNYLTFYWYVDSVLESTAVNVTSGVNSNFTFYFDFFSGNRTNNVTLVATDFKHSSSSFTWLVNVTNVNRAPIYCPGTLQNLTIEGTSTVTNYLSYGNLHQRFYDSDDDPDNTGEIANLTCNDYSTDTLPSLTYELYETAPCSIADFTFTGSDLKIVPSLTGVCLVQFIAEDNYGANVTDTDIVQIIMTAAEGQGGAGTQSTSSGRDIQTETVTVPITHDVDVPTPIQIIAPGTVNMYTNKTIYIQIKIKNTWTTDVRGIRLSAASSNSSNRSQDDIVMNFTKSYFGILQVGAETETTLELSNYRKEGPFEIIVSADVADPDFNDSTTILISAIEQMSKGDQVKVKITFAKDLLSENSVCRELNELLDRADAAAKVESFDEALKLVDGVINGCKYLMKEEEARRESPSMIKRGFDAARKYTLEIVAGAGLLLLLTLTFYAITALKRKLMEK